MGYINDQEWNKYNIVIKYFNEVVLKDFQYKFTNKILVTKSFLHRIRNKMNNNMCLYCKQETRNNFTSIWRLLFS